LQITLARAQDDDSPDDPPENYASLYQSPPTISIETEAVVRYITTADVYLKWAAMPGISSYLVRYKFGIESTTWTAVQVSASEFLLENAPLDAELFWDVTTVGGPQEPMYQSAVGVVSTAPQREPIEVSKKLYGELEYWFSRENNPQGFCEFFAPLPVSKYEKLSFLQAYAFDNANFVKPSNPASATLTEWYPPNAETGRGDGDWCLLVVGDCRCKVITKGSNIATPNAKLENYKVFPVIFESSSVKQRHRLEAGAAKFVSLYQNRSGGQTLEMSNIEGTGDNSSVTTEASEIVFFLACLTPNGGYTTNLPATCQCERPLHIFYEYATNLHVRSSLKSCPWSKGAEATAEDMAFVALYEGKTANLTPLAGGMSGLSNSCSSNWNPDFWIKVVNLLTPLAEFYLETLGNDDAVPSQQQLTAFIDALKDLITTNFSNHNGECGTLNASSVLVSGSHTFMLKPNNPIRVGLFSSYYVRTRGYGCWRAEAGVASDYFLMGVVESQLTDNPECCSDKYANYIAGSQSSPAGSRYSHHAPNTVEARINDVGFLLSTFGSWDGFDEIPGTGIINLLEHQYHNDLYGPSCIDDDDERGVPPEGFSKEQSLSGSLKVYPSLAKDFLNVDVIAATPAHTQIKLLDMKGSVVKTLFSGDLDQGDKSFQFPLNGLEKGVYLVHCSLENESRTFKVIVQ
jgi:hypothetical protein